ncbi:N-formylglutamate amidohydrolase [Frigidibacter sp. RF13]|uniref:N-formylglutamate amidohydrolase n=1 Tax=Frigidibacter sp. RF13 TaxID=2997340 RepID=UPI00226EAE0E|nr:N-formylglutamate amidohydrolase [Frigidibacter sp. RF13]MCY1127486.1 N-formylglutamate amidohydrolase [Frigidibacter sp. RF13]
MTEKRAAVEVVNPAGNAAYVLLCEHASNWLPPEYEGLGLGPADLERHIAWDIGAAAVAAILSTKLDAPLVLGGASRLLIDLNRPLSSPTSIPERSEATDIPGNLSLGDEERQRRVDRWFHPFQEAVGAVLDERQRARKPTRIVAIHSFTPVFLGVARPWRAGILYRHASDFASALVDALGGAAAGIAHNEPYRIEDGGDYTVPVHGEARGLDAVLVEIRHDLIAAPDGQVEWAEALARALNVI